MGAKTFSGSIIVAVGSNIDPSTIINLSDTTSGLSKLEILTRVRYFQPDDPEVPPAISNSLRKLGIELSPVPGMQWRIAVWPDEVWAVLHFPISRKKPRRIQLIRSYRNSRRAQLAFRLHDMPGQGSTS